MLSSEEDPVYLTLYNIYPVSYGKIPIDKTFEHDFLCFERQSFLFWEIVTSAGTYLKFTLAPYTSNFYGNYLLCYLMSTNIFCELHQTMLFFLFLNNLTASNQQGKLY